jgi:hypothetical protein
MPFILSELYCDRADNTQRWLLLGKGIRIWP